MKASRKESKKGAETSREDIVGYVKEYSLKKGEPPSVRNILKTFGISRTTFYGLFRSMDEACERANVAVPKDRNLLIKPAIEAKRRRYAEVHEEVDPKRAFDSAVGEFEREISRAMYRAMLDPNETAEYASIVVPALDPTLWRRLVLLGADVRETVRETFLSKETFLECAKRSKITGEKLPQFRDYVVQSLSERVSRAMENGGYAGTVGDAKDECYRCGRQVRYSPVDADQALFCRSCGTLQSVSCPVCGEWMGKLPPRMLSCGKCGYRLRFKSDLRKEIASVVQYLDELAAGRIPPEEYRMLDVQRRLPDGLFEHTPVTVRPGNVPASLVQKFHPSYISDNQDVSDHLKLWLLFSSRRE